jgi:acyl-coenzyme A synthetase/AMP-(fatty) acid ligase
MLGFLKVGQSKNRARRFSRAGRSFSRRRLFARIRELRHSLPGVELYYLTAGHAQFQGVSPFDDLLTATSIPNRWSALNENCPEAIYYTSGTTGLPKAVIHSHGSLERATQMQIDQIAISSVDWTVSNQKWRINGGARF